VAATDIARKTTPMRELLLRPVVARKESRRCSASSVVACAGRMIGLIAEGRSMDRWLRWLSAWCNVRWWTTPTCSGNWTVSPSLG
jgi:hypothetical protein